MRTSDHPEGTLLYGRFEVQGVLGQGAFARVYKARDRKAGRLCALKCLYHADARQVREPENVQRVRSPNVVEAYDYGVECGDLVWIAMELLDGTTLAARVRSGPPLRAVPALRILGQLCAGLSAAHAQGVVHRDLKPENVFLHDALEGTHTRTIVKILDFGLSKRVTTDHLASMSRVLGTPAYMAPEQWVSGTAADRSTDVWALGLIAFEMLAGKRYWRAIYDAPSDELALRDEILRGELTPPSARARELGRPVQFTAEFEAWFARCVHRSQCDRFRDAAEAAAALPARLVEGEDSIFDDLPSMIVKEEPTPSPPPRAPWKRALAIGAASIAAAVVVAAAGTFVVREFDPVAPAGPFSECPTGMTLVRSQRLPGSVVPVASFCLDASAVTVEQYARCAADGVCPVITATLEGPRDDDGRARCNYGVAGFGEHPMNCIDRRKAHRFCEARNARLPTEAEWSLGARGKGPFPWADGALADSGFRCARGIGVSTE